LQYRNTYIYDDTLLMKVIRTDNSGNEVIINRYAYNENGQLVKEEWYNEMQPTILQKNFHGTVMVI
jgi:beta-galactosidase GanA